MCNGSGVNMNKIKTIGRKAISAPGLLVIGVTAAVLTFPAVASADAVDTGFTSMGTTLLGYLGDAIGLVLVVLGLGLGIRALVKWARVALRST